MHPQRVTAATNKQNRTFGVIPSEITNNNDSVALITREAAKKATWRKAGVLGRLAGTQAGRSVSEAAVFQSLRHEMLGSFHVAWSEYTQREAAAVGRCFPRESWESWAP